MTRVGQEGVSILSGDCDADTLVRRRVSGPEGVPETPDLVHALVQDVTMPTSSSARTFQ